MSTSESQGRIAVGSTGRWSGYLWKDDGTRVGESNITSATIDLDDAASSTAIRDGVVIHNGSAAVGDFDFTDTTVEIDGADTLVTVIGWHIQATDVALQGSGTTRESHVATFTVNYTDGSEAKVTIHKHRLECTDTLGACTVNDVIEQLVNVTEDEQTRDLIERMIEAVTARFEKKCRRTFRKATVTEVFSPGTGETSLWLKRFPIESVTSVKEDVNGDFANGTTIDTDDYYVNSDRGRVDMRRYNLIVGKGSVQVVYVGGLYAEVGAAPLDLRDACARQVAFLWEGRSRLGVASQSVGGVSTTRYATDLLPDVKEVLLDYTRPRY